MYHLITIGDPIIDTHVQIAKDNKDCHLLEEEKVKYLALHYGAKIPITDSFQALGGNAANVAVAAAKLGLKTSLMSTIGDDSNGRIVLELLKKYKVDSDLIIMEHGASTRYSIVLNYQAERTILSYSEKKNYIWPEPVPATDWVYYTGLSEGFEGIQEKLIQYLDEHATTRLAINPGSYMLTYNLDALKEVIAHADLLIVNLEEAEKILNKTREQEKSEAAFMHGLMEMGAKEVVLTDGSRGAWAGNMDEQWHLDPYPVKVVSKTGAGDAFSAGYVAARLHGHDITHALEWGSANSAGVVQAHGPQAGLLDQKGIEKMIEKIPQLVPQPLS